MMKRRWILLTTVVAILAAGGVFYLSYHDREAIASFDDCVGAGNPVSKTYPLQCSAGDKMFTKEGSNPTDEAIEMVVTNFGSVMQLVSTSAPKKIAAQAITDNYRHLIAPSLLAAWTKDPAKAAGRQVSSPWPDHIAITNIFQISTTTYAVTGNVIELTSDNVAHGGVADQYAVTTTVAVEGGNWMITGWESAR